MSQSSHNPRSTDTQRCSVESPAAEEQTDKEGKPQFARPKLTFVPPKLVKHGNVTELTGFFGTFSP